MAEADLLKPDARAAPSRRERPPRLTAVVVGAGMSGLLAAIRLKRAGIDSFVVLEKSNDVGGTWLDNVYPGASCDVASHLYSYSFARNPGWSRMFAMQPEILDYFRGLARKAKLTPHIALGAEVRSAEFDEETGRWTVRTCDGRCWEARFLILGTGQLNKPHIPDIAGRESFAGAQFHSARWDHSVPLEGKRVASIGNGASAVQYVPEVAKVAAEVTVFQRSPNWIVPRPDFEISEKWKRRFRYFPPLALALRFLIYARNEANVLAMKNPRGWMARHFTGIAMKHLEDQVPDPKLRARLTPDYPIGCKRVLVASNYYPTLLQEHVELVTEPIARIVPDGIETESGRTIPLDVIVWGTGFETADFVTPITVKGRGGRDLQESWRGGAEAHKGVTVSSFPGMFLLYGPNTNLGHNSIIFMAEREMDYALKLIQAALSRDLLFIDVNPDAQADYNRALQARLRTSVWAAGCQSWYKHDGKVVNNWSSSTLAFWWALRRADVENYELVPRRFSLESVTV